MSRRFKQPKPPGLRPPAIVLPRGTRSLYKYFSEARYAEAFLDGQLLFRSLAYFRDHEDAARGDEYEGTSNFRPDDGLVITNHTQGTTFRVQMAFESSVKAAEIFVYCVSQELRSERAEEFDAVACIEITDIRSLCKHLRSVLPTTAAFRACPVDYYSHTKAPNPRWALPEQIATSKLARWSSQKEYRFLFSLTDALGFEKVDLRLVARTDRPAPKPEEHFSRRISLGSLKDICVWHDCRS